MVAARMELAVMVSAEELEHLKDIVDDRIESRRQALLALKNEKGNPDYRRKMTDISTDMRVATMLKAKLDVSFH